MQAPVAVQRSCCLTLTRSFQKAKHLDTVLIISDKVLIISILAVCTINALALCGYLTPFELGLSNIGIMCAVSYVTLGVLARYAQNLGFQPPEKARPLTKNLIKCSMIALLTLSAIVAINGAGCTNLLTTELMVSTTLGLFAFNLGAQAWYARQRKEMFRSGF